MANDWSADICQGAALADLDAEAIRIARKVYADKHHDQQAEYMLLKGLNKEYYETAVLELLRHLCWSKA